MSKFLNGLINQQVHFLIGHTTTPNKKHKLILQLCPSEDNGINDSLTGLEEDVSVLVEQLMSHPKAQEVLDSFVWVSLPQDFSQLPAYESKYQGYFEKPMIQVQPIDQDTTAYALHVNYADKFDLVFHIKSQTLPALAQNFLLKFHDWLLGVYFDRYATKEERESIDNIHLEYVI